FVGIRFDPERIAEPITQVPGRSCGASPPATPKLISPGQSPNNIRASAMAAVSVAVRFLPSPPQTTWIPGPAAMRASNASPTMIKSSPQPPPFCGTDRPLVPQTTSNHSRRRLTYYDQLFLFERTTPAVSFSQISCRDMLLILGCLKTNRPKISRACQQVLANHVRQPTLNQRVCDAACEETALGAAIGTR